MGDMHTYRDPLAKGEDEWIPCLTKGSANEPYITVFFAGQRNSSMNYDGPQTWMHSDHVQPEKVQLLRGADTTGEMVQAVLLRP